MPGSVAVTTPSPSPTGKWAEQLEAYLCDAGSKDAGNRKAAELRLAIFPHSQILTHLPRIWQREFQRRERLLHVFGAVALFIALTLIPTNLLLAYVKQQDAFQTYRFTIDMTGLVIMVLAQAGFAAYLGFKAFGSKVLSGAVYALIQHQCVELVPLLIEVLPTSRTSVPPVDSQRPSVIAALTRLLPRFTFADRASLTQRQQDILISELRQFNRMLSNPLATLTPEEADFLTVLLNFVSTEYRSDRRDNSLYPLTNLVEDLSLERVDYHQEPAARTQVREAARAALVRMSA